MDVRQLIRKLIREQLNEANIKTPIEKLSAVKKTAGDDDTIEVIPEELTEGHGLDKDDIKYLKDFISDKKGDARLAKIIKFLIKSNIKVEKTKDLSKDKKEVDEGTCGYGIDGKIGNSPAGPKLRNK
jgi:hypothetical protein